MRIGEHLTVDYRAVPVRGRVVPTETPTRAAHDPERPPVTAVEREAEAHDREPIAVQP